MGIFLQIVTLYLVIQINYAGLFPHYIWVYWDSGYDKLDSFNKLCLQRMIYIHQQTDWEVRFVQDKTITAYLKEENYNRFKKNVDLVQKKFPRQLKSDLLRFFLLKQHGGVWIDMSTILKTNMNWMDDLLNNPRIIHKGLFDKPEAFLNYMHSHHDGQYNSQLQTTVMKFNGNNFYPIFNWQNAIFGAIKESNFVNNIINVFQQLLNCDNPQWCYQKYQRQLSIPYPYRNYFVTYTVCSVVLYKKYFQYFEKVKNNNSSVSLDDFKNHFYNILLLNRELNIYQAAFTRQNVYDYMINQEAPYGDQVRYLYKFHHYMIGPINDLLSQKKRYNEYFYQNVDGDNYKYGMKNVFKQNQCLYKPKINQKSAINKYFFANMQLKNSFFPKTKIIKNSQLPAICRITTLKTMLSFSQKIFQAIYDTLMLLILVEIGLVLYFSIFRHSDQHKKKVDFLNVKIVSMAFFISTIYDQKGWIYNQYQLYKNNSPTALKAICFIIFFTFLMLKWLFEAYLSKANKKNYIFRLAIALVLQYTAIYNLSVWKYQGEVYNYQTLRSMNMDILKKEELQLVYIISAVLTYLIFKIIKWLMGYSQLFYEEVFVLKDFQKIQEEKNIQFINGFQIKQSEAELNKTNKIV